MKDLRKLIRKVLREETNQPDVELDIMNYTGDDKEINKMKSFIYNGKNLTPKNIKYAESFFDKEKKEVGDETDYDNHELETKIMRWVGDSEEMKKMQAKIRLKIPITDEEYSFASDFLKKEIEKRKTSKDTISQKMKFSRNNPSIDQRNKITNLGEKAYKELIGEDLSVFFNNIFNPKLSLKIGKPKKSWFIQNYNDLVVFQQSIKQWQKNVVNFRDGTSMTIEEKINELKDKLNQENFIGIIEKDEWSILNHLDTNYTFWAEQITKRQLNGDLPMGSDVSTIESYFTERRLDTVLPKIWLDNLIKLKKEKNIKVSKMSFAHVDLLEKFHEEKGKEFLEMKDILIKTTTKGEKAEKDFIQLISNAPDKVKNIKTFASWGNVVDMFFGVDLMATFVDGFKIVQVKNKKTTSAIIKRLGIPYLLVFPEGSFLEFSYFSEKNPTEKNVKSFNKDYLKTSESIVPDVTYQMKQRDALEKVLGRTSSDYFSNRK
jgi:hypothetical protein